MSMIDWDAVWQSLEWGHENQEENIKQTLILRAEKYARPQDSDVTAEHDTLKALVFVQGHERYAVPVGYVVRGVSEPKVTRLPCVPPYYRGVINQRGRIVSVLDLRLFWNLPADPTVSPEKLIVLQFGNKEIAIVADDVLEMAHLPLQDVVPALTAGVGLEHVQGVTSDGIVIVDVESLSKDKRLTVHEEI